MQIGRNPNVNQHNITKKRRLEEHIKYTQIGQDNQDKAKKLVVFHRKG